MAAVTSFENALYTGLSNPGFVDDAGHSTWFKILNLRMKSLMMIQMKAAEQ